MQQSMESRNLSHDENQFIVFGIVSAFILFGTHLKLFSLLAFAVCAYTVVFVQGRRSLEMIVFSMSFAHIFKLSANGMSYFTFLVLLYVGICLVKSGSLPTYGVLFAMYIILIQCIRGTTAVFEDVKLIGNVFFLYYAFRESEEANEKGIFLAYVLGVITSAAMRFLDSSFFRIAVYAGETEVDHFGENAVIGSITRFAGVYKDANYFGINAILALCIVAVMYGKRYLTLLQTIVLAAPLLYYSVATGSKSVIIMVALPLCVFCMMNFKSKKHFTQVMFLIGAGITFYLYRAGQLHFLDAVLQRFEGKSLSDPNALTTGRFNVWMGEVDFFYRNPMALLFGIGVGNYENRVWAHNALLESLKYIGIVGTGMMAGSFREAYDQRFCGHKKSIANECGLITVLIMYFFLNQLYGFEFPIHFLLAFMMLNINFNQQNEDAI